MTTNYKWTIRWSILTPFLIIACIFLIGGGHGWYTPAMILFPWATLNTIWQDHLSETLGIIGAFQFIAYGFLVDKAKRPKQRNRVVVGILLSHLILVTLILVSRNSVWR